MKLQSAPIRVASIPSAHLYVENIAVASNALDGTHGHGVVRLPDPTPLGAPEGQWWPPVMLDAAWVDRNAADFDLMHIHFGIESFSREHLVDVIEALRRACTPLVFTVHDLTNPQLVDQARHLEHLDLLIPAADALLTLTDGAADRVQQQWGRRPSVVPHPHLWPLDETPPLGHASEPIVLGTHLRDLRPNIDGVGATEALLGAVAALRAAGVSSRAQIHLREDVRDPDAAALIEKMVESAGADVELVRSPRMSDLELAESIADLDVSVVPYRFGTHSGWVELCFDLGVPVAVPPVGFLAEQHPENREQYDSAAGESLAAAVLELGTRLGSRPGSARRAEIVAARHDQRVADGPRSAELHLDAYRGVLAGTVTA